ncbi:hypothetical protein OQ483_23855 (plasmid) [Enterobacter bugandensis]|uniref:hypothetical protein n=1 Tax=Enterobacter bugandensis TaxID=881260 RepID=UPI00283AA76A|nr:hypothetical protein [Enterobacter bugandensis]WMU75429.1 hypothetical protein OQ483_23855 [Enterobacter bugandensis]
MSYVCGADRWAGEQTRAAEELGIGLRTYKRYEKARQIARLVKLASQAVALRPGT